MQKIPLLHDLFAVIAVLHYYFVNDISYKTESISVISYPVDD